MNRHFVTSFSNKGYEQYGRRFLDGFITLFPYGEVIHVFHEGLISEHYDSERIITHNLLEDVDLVAFLSRHRGNPEYNGVLTGSINYRFQATKWVRKVMALTSPLLPKEGYRIWIDADVSVDKKIPQDFFDQFCDPRYLAQYIGRPTAWDHSECGFVSYHLSKDARGYWGVPFLNKFRALYTSDEVFGLAQWHDSFVFDHLMRLHDVIGLKFKNIAEGHDVMHPWPETVLGEYMTHHKGPDAKKLAASFMKRDRFDLCSEGATAGSVQEEYIMPLNLEANAAKVMEEGMSTMIDEARIPMKVDPDKHEVSAPGGGKYCFKDVLPRKQENLDEARIPTTDFCVEEGDPPKMVVGGQANIMETLKQCKDRYEQLIKIIEIYKPLSIVEVGTWNGERAMLMAAEALRHKKEVFYIGFDLFDETTPPLDAMELNVKKMVSAADVGQKLRHFSILNPGFKYQLVLGNTRETLPGYKFGGQIDFAFIDGGHSVETIRSDYNALKNVAKLIVMDDYYVKGVDTEKWGCNTIIKDEKHAILPMQDNYANGQSIQMVLLGEAMDKGPIKQKVDLKTRNSASDEEIQSHIMYSASLQRSRLEETLKKVQSTIPVKFIEGACKPHDDVLVLIGASEELMDKGNPDYGQTWADIRALSSIKRSKLVICKTSYRKCFEEGVTPWGCVLLDPRDHVAEKIDPNPDVVYFVSSMCHPSTFDKLSGCRVIGYHAIVGAGETDVIKKEFRKVLCVSGGTTSILRGIALFYHLGFRKAIIYGATSSYKKKPEKPHGRSPKPFVNVEVHGRAFLTDPEMIAQSQDAEMAIKLFPDMVLEFKGDGMLNHAVSITREYDINHTGDKGLTDIRVGQWVNAFKTGDEEIEAIAVFNAKTAIQERERYLQKTLEALPDYNSFENWENFGKVNL